MSEALHLLLDNWIVALVFLCVVSGVITSIAKQIRQYGTHLSDTQLKRELVERGLSADEIERIIAAKTSTPSAAKK